MPDFPNPLCKLPTDGDLLNPSRIIAYMKSDRHGAGGLEKQAIMWDMLRHEGRPESDYAASPRRESAGAGLILESWIQCGRISSNVISNCLGEDL
jgi:hypothetical protein